MEDTIAAIATPVGEGGIGIIRISGENSKNILDKLFVIPSDKEIKNRFLTYGHIVDPESKEVIDEVLAVYMKGPKTYTTEDVVEINCHGGVISLKKVLNLVLSHGSRIAEPGEFTRRAFLNGRLDLSQAEAVIDVIHAKTDKSFDIAMNQLQGKFSEIISEIRSKLTDILVDITVNIDYPDEDIEEMTYDKLISGLELVLEKVDRMIEGSKTGKILREGLNVAIIGKPNVGKSSLMNALLRESRAIVTEIPGTTRDTIEEFLSIKGVPIKLTDTAGIRETDDIIEKIGIEKSKKSFEDADLVIFIIDISRKLEDDDIQILRELDRSKALILFNKIDKEQVISDAEIEEISKGCPYIKTVLNDSSYSAVIEDTIYNLVFDGKVKAEDSMVVSNARHEEALRNTKNSLADALDAAKCMQPLEFVEIDVSSAYQSLGLITGDSVREDVIEEVFSRFCLGK